MPGLNTAMITAGSSLLTRQREISTSGNNIAHVNETGYHKQTTIVESAPSLNGVNGQYGLGTFVSEVIRSYDMALETNLKEAINQDGYNQAYSTHLSLLEETLAPQGVSPLNTKVQEFAKSWQALASEPESGEQRQNLLQQGSILADQFNRDRSSLVTLRDTIADASGGELDSTVNQINSYANRITQLNKHIKEIERRKFNSQNANDLRDTRDKIVNELAKLTDITVTEETDNTYTININGDTLVSGTTANAVKVAMTGTGPQLQWDATSTALPTINGGKVAGLLDSYQKIQDTIDDLDTFANQFTTILNTAHGNGFDLNGVAGTDLFDYSTPGQLKFLITDSDKLAAAGATGSAGDNTNALAIWDAMTNSVAALDNNSLLNNVDRLVNNIAFETSDAQALADGSTAAIKMFSDAITTTTGVNLDEEMMNMLNLERAYQASAKFMTIIDQLLGTVINLA